MNTVWVICLALLECDKTQGLLIIQVLRKQVNGVENNFFANF